MGTSGTTFLLLVAAVLWLVYLVPLWLKRSEYYATERNATRLGQTMRLLAHTSHDSPEIEAELSARSIGKQEREAKRQLRSVSRLTRSVMERRRRTKQVFSLALLIGLTSGLIAFLVAWPVQVIWATGAVVVLSLAILGGLNRVGKTSALASASREYVAIARPVVASRARPALPPIPEPLTTGNVFVDAPLPSRDELVRSARQAALASRPEDFATEKLAVVSEFAQMGEVGRGNTERLNLDEVLRRRRAV